MRTLINAATVAWLCTFSVSCSFGANDTGTSTPLDVLKAIEARYAKVTTIQGTFKQDRTDNTFGDTISTRAEFWLSKPSKLRVEYKEPHASVDMLVDGVAYQYVPQLKQVTVLRFTNNQTPMDLNFLLLGFGAKADDVLKVYNVEPLSKPAPAGQVGLKMIPKDLKQANFKNFDLLLTADELIPAEFSFVGVDGTNTKAVLDTARLKIDDVIDSSRFAAKWPDKTRVVEVE